ncbi:MAG: class I SAM-dependent methyltransferase [Sphingopyxis sp.]|uniref:class I SAM-dependent methyltransferase n=1 Tax=Sphingopyxis sp. TaxID=1908224 RepID=UPI002ABB1771|nr:class I SAM-dependent methyltransferase [Sphingopyxis sp.]MDZ3833735.1 class I SAM-dependent methyltransferase [Sphingopyxis sp.]
MPDLLIHSMSEFSDIILESLKIAKARNIVEIGAEYGGMSMMLADYALEQGGHLTSIDPQPKPEFLDWVGHADHVTHIGKPSLSALDAIKDADAWLIDGDHNWFTVYHELQAIDALCRRDEKPLLAFLHDVAWPSGRRDMYYAPDMIPNDARHPHDFNAGAMPGHSPLVLGRGFRGMGHFAWAKHEGGPRNGVKTAVEDFLAESCDAGRDLAYAEVPAVFGLGIVFDLDAPWSSALADHVIPYHENRLIASLEANRLANYLTVLDFQDRAA